MESFSGVSSASGVFDFDEVGEVTYSDVSLPVSISLLEIEWESEVDRLRREYFEKVLDNMGRFTHVIDGWVEHLAKLHEEFATSIGKISDGEQH